tara:strand:+ start:635 stop:934 length:300 start_codon:yes stop_codon:yes gene_type:complete
MTKKKVVDLPQKKISTELNNDLGEMQHYLVKAHGELLDLMEILFDDDAIQHALHRNDYVQAEWLIGEKAPLQRAKELLVNVSELILKHFEPSIENEVNS